MLDWAVSFSLPGLYIYTIVVAIAFHLRVMLAEEPADEVRVCDQLEDTNRRDDCPGSA